MKRYSKYWGYSLSPVLFVLAIAYWSFDFIEQTIRNHPELNLMILLVIALSVLLVLFRQYVIWQEAKIFEGYRTIYAQTESFDVADEFLLGKKGRIVGLLQIISKLNAKIERTIDQQALTAELEAFKENFAANMSLPIFMSGFMVALGLFGTFVGLLETLKSSGELLAGFSQGSTGDLESAVTGMLVGMKGPLSGMATAFSASLFGLLGSLLIGIMINTCQSMSRDVEHELRVFLGHVVKMTDANNGAPIAENPTSNAFLREMMARVMDQQVLAYSVFEQSRQADIETKTLFARLTQQFDERADNIDRLVQIQNDMRQINLQQVEQNQLLIEQMFRHEALLESFNKRMTHAERAGDVLEKIAQQIKDNVQSTAIMVKTLSSTQDQIGQRQERLFEGGMEVLNAYHQSMTESQQVLIDRLKDFGRHLNDEIIRFDQRQMSKNNKFIELQNKTNEMLQHLSERQKDEPVVVDNSIEVVRDIRKNRELLEETFNTEFREIKRMVNLIMRRNKS